MPPHGRSSMIMPRGKGTTTQDSEISVSDEAAINGQRHANNQTGARAT